jgi:uncharacterized membrane protein YdbT with pleckstrin-like domain
MNQVELKKRYPKAKRWVLLKLMPWAFTLTAIVVAFEITLVEIYQLDISISIYLIAIACAIFLMRAFYLLCFFRTYDYQIIGNELIVTRGVIIKVPVGIPLSKINAIHISRTLGELLLGLVSLKIVVPGDLEPGLATLPGFSKSVAEKLKAFVFENN